MMSELNRIREIAEYQFGHGAGTALFPEDIQIEYSKNTGRIRHIFSEDKLLANFRPNDGLFTLTIAGAERLLKYYPGFKYTVTVEDEFKEFIVQGKNLFAKHVSEADEEIRPGQEVVVTDKENMVLGVGRAVLTRDEMFAFKTGVAVKVRRGRDRHT
jgi:predicted RNA-binding protein (TIGR00451 family)